MNLKGVVLSEKKAYLKRLHTIWLLELTKL